MNTVEDRAALRREDRQFQVAPVEIRSGDDTGLTFEGIASTVDSPYTVTDMFGDFEETIERGAFDKTLAERDDVRLLVNHDGIPLARTKSKTLELTTVPHLRATARLDDQNPTVQEIRSAMVRGDLDQMSIGFRVMRQEWNGDYTERTIREVKLFDVSVVTYPANPTTSASLRSLLHETPTDATELRAAIDRLTAALREIEPEAVPEPDLGDLDRRYERLRELLADMPLPV